MGNKWFLLILLWAVTLKEERNMKRNMKKSEVEALFVLAGITALRYEPLIDGYGYDPNDSRYYEKPRVWWFVKTPLGWVKIGCRTRVISIEWSDTPIRKVLTEEDVTKGETYIHAWNEEDALRYLKTLAVEMGSLKPPQTKGE